MSSILKFDISKAQPFINEQNLEGFSERVGKAHQDLHKGTGLGNEYLGWVDLPVKQEAEVLNAVENASREITDNNEALVVIGIGGSFLGARAVIELLNHSFDNQLTAQHRSHPKIYYLGQTISPTYTAELLDVLAEQDFAVNIISKSGTTTEPALAFRLTRDLLVKKYGREQARRRIFVTTDPSQGALKRLAEAEGYTQLAIPSDVGGRYSVLTPVGLLPIAVSGVKIRELLSGAAAAYQEYLQPDLAENNAYRYAVARQLLYKEGKLIEILATYEPGFHYLAEWWKQLFGESEGKQGQGIFPVICDYSTDLHSMGQYVQEGRRHLFETVLWVEKPRRSVKIVEELRDIDGLNFLSGKTLEEINQKAFEGTLLAHQSGGVPNLIVRLPETTPYTLGHLIYFFEKACAMSGYLAGINPFDQPGVEAYKRNIFALLGKAGYERERQELEERLK